MKNIITTIKLSNVTYHEILKYTIMITYYSRGVRIIPGEGVGDTLN